MKTTEESGLEMEIVAVIDFETTGLSPAMGDRATEIAVVLVQNGQVIRRYQSLMNAGVKIPRHIQALTGITNNMIEDAPSATAVMREVSDFVEDFPLVAHNAAFDKRFWDAELARLPRTTRNRFACSMLIARRVLPQAPSHKLGELVAFAKLPVTGKFHRAQADAEMTASLLTYMQDQLQQRYKIDRVSHDLWCRIQKASAAGVAKCVAEHLAGHS